MAHRTTRSITLLPIECPIGFYPHEGLLDWCLREIIKAVGLPPSVLKVMTTKRATALEIAIDISRSYFDDWQACLNDKARGEEVEMLTRTIPIWPDRVYGPNAERHIAAGDWRDPDEAFDFDGCRVGVHDPNVKGASEPDWSKGWYLWRGNEDQKLWEGMSRPPEFLVRAFLEGRVLYGVLVARDEQKHN